MRSRSGPIRRTEALFHALLRDHGYACVDEERWGERRRIEYHCPDRGLSVVVERAPAERCPHLVSVFSASFVQLAACARVDELRALLERGVA